MLAQEKIFPERVITPNDAAAQGLSWSIKAVFSRSSIRCIDKPRLSVVESVYQAKCLEAPQVRPIS